MTNLKRYINTQVTAMKFDLVIEKLNDFAPLHFAQLWDNVGILIQPPQQEFITKILLTNDLTLAVMEEAEENEIDLILSYHPPIFRPLKSVTSKHWKEEIVGRCLSKNISVYSPHTSYDALKGGVNDWLIDAFDGTAAPINSSWTKGAFSHKLDIINISPSDQGELIRVLDASNLQREVSFINEKNFMSVLCKEKNISAIVQTLLNCHNDAKFSISKCENIPISDFGDGRQMKLNCAITIEAAVNRIKQYTGLSKVRLALKHKGGLDDTINSVAVCAGSGSSVLKCANADLLLTGEMSHHEVLDWTQRGISVILVEHSNSERGFLSGVLQQKLSSILGPSVNIMVSQRDEDPLKIV